MMDNDRELYQILETNTPEAAFREVQMILKMIFPAFDVALIRAAFETSIRLFKGSYPGYQACNTQYHDFSHTLGVFLAMTRLVHGATLDDKSFSERAIARSLVSALFHDAGYIQDIHDREGTGAKHTRTHVLRSMDFLARHGPDHGLSDEEIEAGQIMISYTDPAVNISTISHPSPKVECLGKMLAVADFFAQMADRMYLEKLLYLYHEFEEGGVPGYENELDLLHKTIDFYRFTEARISTLLYRTDHLLCLHFEAKWHICENLYKVATEKQEAYLHKILKSPDPLKLLKRGGIVKEIRRKNNHGKPRSPGNPA